MAKFFNTLYHMLGANGEGEMCSLEEQKDFLVFFFRFVVPIDKKTASEH